MRSKSSENAKLKHKKGLWSPDEDQKLRDYILNHGLGCWSAVSTHAGDSSLESSGHLEGSSTPYSEADGSRKLPKIIFADWLALDQFRNFDTSYRSLVSRNTYRYSSDLQKSVMNGSGQLNEGSSYGLVDHQDVENDLYDLICADKMCQNLSYSDMRPKPSETPQANNKKGLWSPDEDLKLKSFIINHGRVAWKSVPIYAGYLLTGPAKIKSFNRTLTGPLIILAMATSITKDQEITVRLKTI
ncbi:hypothetical protein Ccrd_011467 [Cynara cardunculus var. scolymus]|uniref:Homeodomain-like protein n=1 Tax=Cynara cardunculus var. scolymus TaxID=59895 RepID=A0A103YJB8_CYNCS|nr:hypothetical protein Ccrd_011467 [Cynara cardunculus var. scolymus]